MKTSFRFLPSEQQIFAKREVMLPSKWAPKYTIVQDGLYAGSPPRMDVSPYMPGILNTYSLHHVGEIVVCGSLQIGKTLILYICLGWSMDYRHGTKMITMPTKESRDRVKKEKLIPFLKGSSLLKKMIASDYVDRISLRNGQNIWLANAESQSSRASITVRDLFLDEEDLYGVVSNGASPVDDFKGRTRSLGGRAKILRVSQPKGDESSSIWQGLITQCEEILCYEVKCVACNTYHLPDVLNIKAAGEKDLLKIRSEKLARYTCPFCETTWSDHLRDVAVQNGRWAPYSYSEAKGFIPCEKKEKPRSVGFHVPAILARSVSLSQIYTSKVKADKSDDVRVKTQFYNDELGMPYSPVELLTDSDKIMQLKESWLPPRAVPHGTIALTCGIDVQKRGFYFLVQAWSPNLSNYIVDYGFLQTWEEVNTLCFDTYYPVLLEGVTPIFDVTGVVDNTFLTGEVMQIWRGAIDSGGTEGEGIYTRTEEVYLWTKANGRGVIHMCKGSSRSQTTTIRRSVLERMPHNGKAIKGGVILHLLDVNVLKTLAMSRLVNPESTQPTRLHALADEDFAKQIASEQQVRKNNKLVWERKHTQNHYFDCLVLSSACADVGWAPSLPAYITQIKNEERNLHREPRVVRKKQKPQKQSRWG